FVAEIVGLVYVERVHVGAQANRPPGSAGAQHAHHAGLGQAPVGLDSELLQLVGDDIGGPYFLEGRFRVAVNVMPPGSHVLMERVNTIDHRHTNVSKYGADGTDAPPRVKLVEYALPHI